MKIIVEITPDGNVKVFCNTPADVEVIDWKEVKEQAESCPTLYAKLPEQTERHLTSVTAGMTECIYQ
jgi:hypothetical protein